ncbi:dTDP-4-dehydrorhamnose reductase [Ensifer aridi]|uniref:dTDP-4-dehydrorhamnose reductase n=1 Tax=Ensifer aridi TaxID=1708715 RepID=UPI000614FA3C|nr:dTDP-4-dehydrorhamnose reductase [Ensifer aridi]
MRRILITGGTGQVGTELLRCSWPEDIRLIAPTRTELDLSNCDAVANYVAAGRFSAVINSGAYTAVDKAESDVLAAWKVNALAPAALASAAKVEGIPIIHISTDYVFDGSKDQPYVEDDPVAPLGVYGASKEAGEQAVRTGNPRHVILRTAWVFSEHGTNFVKTMLRLAAERPLIKIVSDQKGSPTAARDIASTIKLIACRLLEDRGAHFGTYNFVNSGEATWYDLGVELFEQQGIAGFGVPVLQAIRTSEYPTPARRPSNSRLSTEKLSHDYGIQPQRWQAALSETLRALQKQQGKLP